MSTASIVALKTVGWSVKDLDTNLVIGVQGGIAGAVMVADCARNVEAWAALLIGALAGLLFCMSVTRARPMAACRFLGACATAGGSCFGGAVATCGFACGCGDEALAVGTVASLGCAGRVTVARLTGIVGVVADFGVERRTGNIRLTGATWRGCVCTTRGFCHLCSGISVRVVRSALRVV